MEEGEKSKGWLVWVIVIPLCMALGAVATRWAMKPFSKPSGPPPPAAQAQAPQAAPVPAEAPPADNFELPGDEAEGKEAEVVWSKPGAAAPQPAKTAAAPEPAPAPDAGDSKKDQSLGLAYGALTKATEKLLGNPKAIKALLSNDYVVKGFMSRDTVKKATASSASLAAYLKNPDNLSQFMGKSVVQRGINNQQLVDAVASSKLAGALLDTPGGRALLKDTDAIGEIMRENPAMVNVLTNPVLLNALMQNPKTAEVAAQIGASGNPLAKYKK